MDMVDKIEQFLIEENIKEFALNLTNSHRHDKLCKENIYIIQNEMDKYLQTLSRDFIYDYNIYTDGSRIKFSFNIKRRFLYGFLG